MYIIIRTSVRNGLPITVGRGVSEAGVDCHAAELLLDKQLYPSEVVAEAAIEAYLVRLWGGRRWEGNHREDYTIVPLTM